MTNKERYSKWVEQQEYVPIMMTPWWLDAVCAGKEWNVLFAEDEQGEILGAMPYLLRKRLWQKFIVMPQQTQTGGIWVTAEVTDQRAVGSDGLGVLLSAISARQSVRGCDACLGFQDPRKGYLSRG